MKNLTLVILVSLSLIACDKLHKADTAMDSVNGMGDKMDKTVAELENTKEKIRMQEALISLKEIISTESMDRLFPVPTGLMPFAETFAKAATPKEIFQLTYLWLKEIDEIKPLNGFDSAGKETSLSLEKQNQVLVEKFGRLQALMAIAGFAPQEKIDSMIETEIKGSGRFRKSVLNVLMFRALFLRQILLQESLLKYGRFESVGEAEEALKYTRQLDWILRLPFRSEISARTTGLKAPAGYEVIGNLEIQMDTDTMSYMTSAWGTLAELTEKNLKLNLRSDSADLKENQAILARDQARAAAVIREAKAQAESWKNSNVK